MQAYIISTSALEYYRANREVSEIPDDDNGHLQLNDAARTLKDLEDAPMAGLLIPEPSAAMPLQLLAPSKTARSTSCRVHTTVCGDELPSGSFVKGNAYVSISTPEFVFVQMARELSLVELVELGMELCGTYRLACEHYSTRYKMPVLTTPARLRDYIKRASGMRGTKLARAALNYVLPGSASPMETVLYLLLCLPRRLGGYAFPKPALNKEVKIMASGRRFTLRKSSYPDLYWKAKKLDLEYHGSTHEEVESRAEDSMRRKALERMGYDVYELTYPEINNLDLFHSNVRRLANRLGIRLRSRGEGDFAAHEAQLRETLLGHKADRLWSWEQDYWDEVTAAPTRSWREIAESYGITELPSQYESWEEYLRGYTPFEV